MVSMQAQIGVKSCTIVQALIKSNDIPSFNDPDLEVTDNQKQYLEGWAGEGPLFPQMNPSHFIVSALKKKINLESCTDVNEWI